MKIKKFNEFNGVQYETYCGLLDYYCLGKVNEEFLGISGVSDSILGAFKSLKKYLGDISTKLGISVVNIIKAFKQKGIFEFLKGFNFNFSTLTDYLNKTIQAMNSGINKIFDEIAKSGVISKLKSGTMKVDELLNKYPILKKISGPVLAGLLIFIWINSSFGGDLDEYFDLSNIGNALIGKYTISDLFLSSSGLKVLSLWSAGSLISLPGIVGSIPASIIIALIYTGYKKLKKDTEILNKIKSKFKSTLSKST